MLRDGQSISTDATKDLNEEIQISNKHVSELKTKTSSLECSVNNLSGGNIEAARYHSALCSLDRYRNKKA